MTATRDTNRRHFAATVADAADAVASALATHPVRGTEPYPISVVLPVLIEQHRVLQEAVDGCGWPLAVNAAGKQDPLIEDLGGLMSFLQLARVLYHGLEDVPDWLQVSASRNLSTVHLTARRVRDQARRQAR